jgi:anti-sigma factor RsiW
LNSQELPGQERAEVAAAPGPKASRLHRRAFLAGAVALLALIGMGVFLRRADLPEGSARDFEAASRGALLFDLETDEPLRMETLFWQLGIPFRVPDLDMLQYRLVGGRVHSLGGKPTLLVVYHGPADRLVVCEMLPGALADLGRDGRHYEHGGIEFLAYRRGSSNQVFWQEGDVLCVLVSDAPVDEVVKLAFDRARKA